MRISNYYDLRLLAAVPQLRRASSELKDGDSRNMLFRESGRKGEYETFVNEKREKQRKRLINLKDKLPSKQQGQGIAVWMINHWEDTTEARGSALHDFCYFNSGSVKSVFKLFH